ncbi:MAG: cytidylate kinase-like family protein [Pirellulales bacterium]
MSQSRGLSEVAERQMRNWALTLQTQQRLAEEGEVVPVPQLIRPYLAISREAGVDAGDLAQEVAAKCGWKVLDRELLDFMAEHDHLSRLALEFVDERAVSWFHEMFGKWLDEQLVSQAEYVARLGRLVLLAAQHESTIFVGRGAQFMLPRDRGLAIRIIAPQKDRIRHVMKKRQCSERDAKKFVDETDHGRAQFVQRYFHRDVTDPHQYDVVVNLERMSRDDAIDLIAHEVKQHEQRLSTEESGHASAQRQFRRLNQPYRPKR